MLNVEYVFNNVSIGRVNEDQYFGYVRWRILRLARIASDYGRPIPMQVDNDRGNPFPIILQVILRERTIILVINFFEFQATPIEGLNGRLWSTFCLR